MLPLLFGLAIAEPETIVVTGRGLAAGETVGAALVTLDAERIGRSASGRLEDVLRDAAGVQSFRRSDSRSSHATNQSITLRGLGGNASSRALLLLDGVPQGDPFGGWITFPAFATDRLGEIRIRRGAGSAYFGPGALAGTVELESAAPGDDSLVRGSLAYGSRDSLDARASVALSSPGRFANISGALARGDGFVPILPRDRGPIDRRAPYRQASGALRVVQEVGGATEAQLNFSGFEDKRDRGVPFTANRGRGMDTSLRLVGKGRTRWSMLGYAQLRNFVSDFSSINAARTTSTQTLDQYSVPSRGLGFRGELLPRLGKAELRLGADGRFVRGETRELYQFVDSSPTRRRVAGGRSTTLGLFAAATLPIGPAFLSVSGRADRWTITDGRFIQQILQGPTLIDTAFPDRSGWQGSGRVAGELKVAQPLTLRAAAYRGWRLPTLNELYRPFRAGADATGPNPDLRPETMVGAEIGGDLALRRGWTLSLTAYQTRLDDAIANVTQGNGPGTFPIVGFVAAGGSYRQRQNLDTIRSRGLEADLAGKVGAFDARLSYSLVDARVRGSGAALPLDGKRPAQTPRQQASATLGWQVPAGWQASGTFRALSSQYEDDLNLRRLKATVTLDAFASAPLGQRWRVELRGENLLDEVVQASVSADGVIERALPRTLWIGLRLR